MQMNYKSALNAELLKIADSGETPSLLLHSCCAPCSSYVLDMLSRYFRVTVLYYNPNIFPQEEFNRRAAEQTRLLLLTGYENPVEIIIGRYDADAFERTAELYAGEPEGGNRCAKCIRLRLCETAKTANAGEFDYFTTTLTVSPHKNAAMINEIGTGLSSVKTKYLISDFKKNDGYKRSVELSRQFGLYRQDYCGCRYSMRPQSVKPISTFEGEAH